MPPVVKVTLNDRKLKDLIRTAPDKAENAIQYAALDGQRYVMQSFGTGARGRTYRRRRKYHVASAAGSPPAVDTGALKNSISIEKPARFRRYIVVGVEHGMHLEFGTVNMAARPFMRPMAEWLRGNMRRLFDDFAKV
jgi:hypothetical protein